MIWSEYPGAIVDTRVASASAVDGPLCSSSGSESRGKGPLSGASASLIGTSQSGEREMGLSLARADSFQLACPDVRSEATCG
jgi:hypothetical protein